ncbi:MAG: hypothetical protein CME88_02575 [Hirschia sp.]|nr:hypothetical protein [Hirschia sp.]MBF17248.1 hypothetical protein [Hirschia sp.]|tara:strand:- start:260 stop:541 length:282 start_codon:yes stop_codon:yes gene_type:complete
MTFWVYILASGRNGTLYIGQTDELSRRIWEHKQKLTPGFTSKYGVDQLVWMAEFPTRDEVKSRERQIKAWKRAWKLDLIEKDNPDWKDLYWDL